MKVDLFSDGEINLYLGLTKDELNGLDNQKIKYKKEHISVTLAKDESLIVIKGKLKGDYPHKHFHIWLGKMSIDKILELDPVEEESLPDKFVSERCFGLHKAFFYYCKSI